MTAIRSPEEVIVVDEGKYRINGACSLNRKVED